MSKSPDQSELRSLLKKVREIEIRSRSKAESLLSGEYKTVFKGSGIEFEEVREYIRGDDTRSIDWNVTARTGKLFVKQYSEERELTVFLMIDVSGSQYFGTFGQFKKDLAVELAAVLSLSAAKSKDKIGLILFSDRIEKVILPKKGRSHVLLIIRELLAYQPASRRTDISVALSFVNKLLKRKSILFLLSDFYAKLDKKVLAITERKHDLVPVVLRDNLEEQLPSMGLIAFENPETGDVDYIDTSSSRFRTRFFQAASEHAEGLRRMFLSLNMDYISINTGSSYLELLMNFFKKRAKRY